MSRRPVSVAAANAAAAALAAAMLLASCSSSPEPEVFSMPDYTAADVRAEEILRIDGMLAKKDNVRALWRSLLLGDDSVSARAFAAVRAEFDEAAGKGDWLSARRLWRSLAAAGSPDLGSLPVGGAEIERRCVASVPGLSRVDVTPRKVSEFVSGTVTVWVDKGIKIERGLGHADRVIGSGFFISSDGYVVTNHHVIEDVVDPKNKDYSRLFVKLAEDSDVRIPARVVGWDPVLDLALLKAEVDAPFVFNLGSSEGLDAGDRIFAIGSPVGLERTLTSGIVSATDRKLFTLGSVMQIDAAVNSGNSGGPCIDSGGNVQAIVFAGMLQYEGLNFAIPVEYLKALLPALHAGGKVVHPWVGAFGRTWRGLGSDSGLMLQYVLPGGSAFRAGLRAGDVVVSADGAEIRSLEDFQNVLLGSSVRSIVRVRYVAGADGDSPREGECLLYLDERPESPGKAVYEGDLLANAFVPIFGMQLASTSERSRGKYSIVRILGGSIADESGFSENEPVEVRTLKFNDENTAVYAEVYAKNRKRGYIDSVQMLVAPLDSPYYF